MIRRLLVTAIASGTLLGVVGCHHHKCCSNSPGGQLLPPAPGGPGTIPPTSLPTSPIPSVGPSGPAQPEFLQPRPGNYGPPPANGRPQPEILLPDPLPGGPSSRSAYPAPPGGPPFLGAPVTPKPLAEPPLASKPPVTAPKPAAAPTAGLPGYTRIQQGVATGRKPTLDGFDSLKAAGFRSVAYLHPAGADVSPARDLAEQRGFTFVAIETTPETLAEAFRKVGQLVTDRATQPVYVFDDDGLRAGAVWYLHFRTADSQAADTARIRANGIGLTDQTDEGRAFWVAIQQFLANR
jgi:hypothetical protein